MTREMAIYLLHNIIGRIEANHGANYDEALNMGIEALEKQKLYEHLYFQIGEALVDVSKCDISQEYCIEKIRNAMKEFDYVKNRSEKE